MQFFILVFWIKGKEEKKICAYLEHPFFSGGDLVISVGLVNMWTINHMIPKQL